MFTDKRRSHQKRSSCSLWEKICRWSCTKAFWAKILSTPKFACYTWLRFLLFENVYFRMVKNAACGVNWENQVETRMRWSTCFLCWWNSCPRFRPGVYNLLLLPAALLLFIWSTAANEFELYLWDSANQHRTHSNKLCNQSITTCDITIQIVTHRGD